VRSAGELRKLLADIRAGAGSRQIAIAVNVMTTKKNAFSLVVGLANGSILTYDGQDGEPPYFISQGDTKKDISLASYYYGGQRSELPESHVISEGLALDALVDSIENEKPSLLIQWYGG
jgi:hypothetical protein